MANRPHKATHTAQLAFELMDHYREANECLRELIARRHENEQAQAIISSGLYRTINRDLLEAYFSENNW